MATPSYGGGNAFGSRIAPLSLPPNLYTQVNAAVPGAAPLAGQSADFIGTELAGQVAPDVHNLLQQKAAAMGVNAGQPMTGGAGSFSSNNFLANLGLTSQGLKQQGNADYLNFLHGVGAAQTDPQLAYELSLQNAVDASAPDPAAAAKLQMQLSRPSGGTGYSFPSPSTPTPDGSAVMPWDAGGQSRTTWATNPSVTTGTGAPNTDWYTTNQNQTPSIDDYSNYWSGFTSGDGTTGGYDNTTDFGSMLSDYTDTLGWSQ